MEFNIPASLDLTWRVMRQADAAKLACFEADCSMVDGRTAILNQVAWEQKLRDPGYNEVNSVIALDNKGLVAAAGWIHYQDEVHEAQGFVDGRVHPSWRGRGIGAELLAWLEARATEQLDKKAGERQRILRILYYDRGEDALALFKSAGYHLQFSEVEMRVQIRDRSRQAALPEGFLVEAWTPDNTSRFYRAYCEAFQTRTDHLSPEEMWSHHFMDQTDGEFSPLQSILITMEGEPAGYVVVHCYDREDGVEGKEYWIAQVGVAPEHRRRGLARWMLQHVMNEVRALDYVELTLTVNVNNPGAVQVYERMGFRAVKTMTLLRKELD